MKQNPLYEKDGFTLLDTHYYGGIKKYQWVAIPLGLRGVVAKTDGSVVPVSIGDASSRSGVLRDGPPASPWGQADGEEGF